MKPSPVQLLQLMFKHVRVELDPSHLPAEMVNPLTSAFTFDGVNLQSEVGFGLADAEHERGKMYFVELRVVVDNEPVGDQTEQRFCPYKIDVAAVGTILIPKSAEVLADPEDLASVNGASLLWSAVREQVLTITSRMNAGPVMLPTVHFHDLKKPSASAEPAAALPAAAVKKVRRPAKH